MAGVGVMLVMAGAILVVAMAGDGAIPVGAGVIIHLTTLDIILRIMDITRMANDMRTTQAD
jgi:hypothetical protein